NTVCELYVVNDVNRFDEAFGNTQFSRFLTDDALVPFLRSLGTGLSWGSSWSKRLGVNADDWKTATAGSVGVAVLHPARDRAVRPSSLDGTNREGGAAPLRKRSDASVHKHGGRGGDAPAGTAMTVLQPAGGGTVAFARGGGMLLGCESPAELAEVLAHLDGKR